MKSALNAKKNIMKNDNNELYIYDISYLLNKLKLPVNTFLFCFLIYIFFIAAIPATLHAQNQDSLSYLENLNQIKKNNLSETTFSSAIETAKELAEAGLFKEAAELLTNLVLSANTQKDSLEKRKKVLWQVDAGFMFNKVKSINKNELTSQQSDSIELLKKTLGYTGLSADIQINKWGITNIKPIIYASNIALAPRLQINADILNQFLQIENVVGVEKKLGDFYPDTNKIDTANSTGITPVTYRWNDLAKDSSDLFSNKLTIAYSNNASNKNPVFSIPLIWTFMNFRNNRPILTSRSNLALNPYFEYRLNSAGLTFSGNWYSELMNYFGDGRVLDRDTLALNRADFLDRFYNNPQITISYYLKKLNVELSESILDEFFFKRENLFNNLKSRLNSISDNMDTGDSIYYKDTINVTKYEQTENSLWWDSKFRATYRLFSWFYPKIKLSFLYVKENEKTIIYSVSNNKFMADDSSLILAGTDFIVEPQFDFRMFNNTFRVDLNYSFENRKSPIYDSIYSDCKFTNHRPTAYYTTRYLWETYKAHETSVRFSFMYDILQIKVSEAFRHENISDNIAFEICDNSSWRTRWDAYFLLTPSISLSCMGDIEFVTNKLGTLLNDKIVLPEKTSNISISANTIFRF